MEDQNKEILALRKLVEHLQAKIKQEVPAEDMGRMAQDDGVDSLDTSDGRPCATPFQPSIVQDEDIYQ